MSALDSINAKIDTLSASAEAANAKADLLIAGNADLRAQIVLLQDRLTAGSTITAGDLASVLARLDSVTQSIDAQAAQDDAALSAAGAPVVPHGMPADPGTNPVPGSVPESTPPTDDAFVAVGATRFSDGQVQTAESLAAAEAAYAAAHPV